MVRLLDVLLAIILHTPSFLYAHSLAKRELPLPTDADHKLISDLPMSQGNLWEERDDRISYLKDYVKNANERLRSRLLSSLIDDFKGLGKLEHPEIQFSDEFRSPDKRLEFESHWKEHESHDGEREEEEGQEEDEEEAERDPKPGEQEESRKQNGEQQKEEEIENYEEEGRRRYEEKYRKPEVHLFGLPGQPQQRSSLEQFKHLNTRRIEIETGDRQRTRENQSNRNKTDDSPLISRVERPAATHFSYIHPEEWSLDNPECSGRLQSPVNLDSDKFVDLEVPSSLIWNGYWNRPENLTITDTGHSVELRGTWDEKRTPFISGGPLIGDYLFAQLHFHWGTKDSVGSEHTINNNSFPMEMHMVHYKRDYGSLNNALKHDDGLAVVAFLFEISENVNFGISFLEDSLSKIQNKPGAGIPVKSYPLALLHFIFHEDYASYIGSLTTPPCREIVTWLVSSTPLSISHKQMESFRKISNKWPEKENYRPRQALNGRRLYYVAH